MNCVNCRAEILDNAAFCPNCGTKVAPQTVPQTVPQYGQPVYQTAPHQGGVYQQPTGPVRQLKTNRSFIADAPRATVGSTGPNAKRTATKRGGARNGCTRRQSCDCRAVHT